MKEIIKTIVGSILIIILPKKAKQLSNKGMTIVVDLTLKERLMRHALLGKAKKNEDFETLSQFHQDFWTNKGEEYFSGQFNDHVLEYFFIPKCLFLFTLMQKELQEDFEKCNMIVEIGTGDGKVLQYLSNKFPQKNRFIGLDLSSSQIEANKKFFDKVDKLEFVAADAFDWIEKNREEHMIIFTSRGVLEYFTQSKLQIFFYKLNSIGKIIFIAIEPTGVNHNYLKNLNSEIYGSENSFSHNYAKLFREAGFEIWHHSTEKSTNECNMNFIGAKN